MSENSKPCPQFPYWGAHYPDACCIDGKLYDLDKCDNNGKLYEPTGHLRYAHYKGVRNLGAKRCCPRDRRPRRDKKWNRIMKRSEKQQFKIFMDECLFDKVLEK